MENFMKPIEMKGGKSIEVAKVEEEVVTQQQTILLELLLTIEVQI
jgi:hypothetical protein